MSRLLSWWKRKNAHDVLQAIETLNVLFTPDELKALDQVIAAFQRTPYKLIVRER